MKRCGGYSVKTKKNKIHMYDVFLEPTEILGIFKELSTNPKLSEHYTNIDQMTYNQKIKPFEYQRMPLNVYKIDNERYNFDLLNEEATILYNLLMRLELEDYEAAIEIIRIYKELVKKMADLQGEISWRQIVINPDDKCSEKRIALNNLIEQRNSIKKGDIFKYYKALSKLIRIVYFNTISAEDLEKQIVEAEALIKRNEKLLMSKENPLVFKYQNKHF